MVCPSVSQRIDKEPPGSDLSTLSGMLRRPTGDQRAQALRQQVFSGAMSKTCFQCASKHRC
jgi:hypothetical protein